MSRLRPRKMSPHYLKLCTARFPDGGEMRVTWLPPRCVRNGLVWRLRALHVGWFTPLAHPALQSSNAYHTSPSGLTSLPQNSRNNASPATPRP